ncbi:MAG: hypothetical protein JWP57_1044 [Spirosoma sp.]|nr:hypothetical protein [Spirosoma sp.]
MNKKLIVILLLLTAIGSCTHDQSAQPPTQATLPQLSIHTDLTRLCRRLIWRAYNSNYYVYTLDSTNRLKHGTIAERTNSGRYYPIDQYLIYTSNGLLEQVRELNGSSQYMYHNGQLTAIQFSQAGKPIYCYQVSHNSGGQIDGLRGIPLNNSGLPAYSTQYLLDQQGRYVQLDVRTDQGALYYRVVQSDFDNATSSPYALIRGIPYDLNRFSWMSWGEVFPLSPHLARRIQTYQYAAPNTPTQLIKRSDLRLTYRPDPQGYMMGQFSTDALTAIQDTVSIDYQPYH